MKVIINVREEARKNKDFKTSDAIRAQLKDSGVELEDSEQGVKWKIMHEKDY